jgi:hypothetical protein
VTGNSETCNRASPFVLVFVVDIFIGINALNYPNKMQSIEFLSTLIRVIIQT